MHFVHCVGQIKRLNQYSFLKKYPICQSRREFRRLIIVLFIDHETQTHDVHTVIVTVFAIRKIQSPHSIIFKIKCVISRRHSNVLI